MHCSLSVDSDMSAKSDDRPRGKTTVAQRVVLFQTWEETNNIEFSCRQADVSTGTFYYWRPNFERYGYVGLEQSRKKGSKKLKSSKPKRMRINPSIKELAIQLIGESGKPMHYMIVADEIMKRRLIDSSTPYKTIYSILVRSRQLVKVGPGTFGLVG